MWKCSLYSLSYNLALTPVMLLPLQHPVWHQGQSIAELQGNKVTICRHSLNRTCLHTQPQQRWLRSRPRWQSCSAARQARRDPAALLALPSGAGSRHRLQPRALLRMLKRLIRRWVCALIWLCIGSYSKLRKLSCRVQEFQAAAGLSRVRRASSVSL